MSISFTGNNIYMFADVGDLSTLHPASALRTWQIIRTVPETFVAAAYAISTLAFSLVHAPCKAALNKIAVLKFSSAVPDQAAKQVAMTALKYAAVTAAGWCSKPEYVEAAAVGRMRALLQDEPTVDLDRINRELGGQLTFKPAFEEDGQRRMGCILDERSGLKMSLIQGNDELIINFASLTGSNALYYTEKRRIAQKKACQNNLLGGSHLMFSQARRLVKEVSQTCQGQQIVVSGQSMGGTLAQYAAAGLAHVKIWAFNSQPLGAGLQRELGNQNLKILQLQTTQFSTFGDYMSAIPLREHFFELVRKVTTVRSPRNFGKQIVIPSVYANPFKNHSFPISAIQVYLGFDARTPLWNLPL